MARPKPRTFPFVFCLPASLQPVSASNFSREAPRQLRSNTGYAPASMLNGWSKRKVIAPHIPVFDKSKRDDGAFSRNDFRYEPTGDGRLKELV
jgi:hypothetical protein